ncbi:MAG TPA: type II CAAX endopeptidase family protein [Longimicrobiales bacterium]|nr:type II CAAX endopeptidase family protein [Longimicrobiales bacterium]
MSSPPVEAVDAGRPSDRVGPRDGWIALAYLALYLGWLFRHQESELEHWITMVVVPLGLAAAFLPREKRSPGTTLASLGLRRGNLGKGLGWAFLIGGLITVFQVYVGGNAEAIQGLIRSGRAFWLFPLTLLLMAALAGLTEEVLFRGFLQTRLERLLHSRWGAVLLASMLFGLYHLPYAYLNPRWPSHGDWGAAWGAALGNGVPGGLVLGALYVVSGGNLLACVVLHSLVNAAPAMTLIHFGGG